MKIFPCHQGAISTLSKATATALAALMLAGPLAGLAPREAAAFSVDFASGTPAIDALRALGVKAGRNIVVSGEVDTKVAIHIADADFDTAVAMIAAAGGFTYEIIGDTVIVGDQDDMESFDTFRLKHLDPEYVATQIKPVLDDVTVNSDLHTVTVKGARHIIEKLRQDIARMDVAQQQVTVQAEFVELSKGKAREMGLSYGSDSWTKDTSASGYNGFVFTVTGAHEENLTSGKILARPNVTVFDGRTATVMMGDKVPVFTSESESSTADASVSVEYKDVGIQLEVTPRINDFENGIITMTLEPTVSTITEWVESGNNKAPQISERSVETTVRVKSGQTIFIGGLLKDEEIKSIKAIPFLSKIPVLGELFKSRSIEKNRSEILIAITPTLVSDKDGNGTADVGKQTALAKTVDALHRMQDEETATNSREKDAEEREAKQESRVKRLTRENQALKEEIRRSNRIMKDALARIGYSETALREDEAQKDAIQESVTGNSEN